MEWKYYGKLIREDTIGRCDVSPLFSDPKVFSNLVKDLITPFNNLDFDKIVAIDALGFILGGAMALKTKKPLILIRKGGKLPFKAEDLIRAEFMDYSKNNKSFEIQKGSIKEGERVIIVDEWIETGAQVKTAIEIIEKMGAKVVGISSINVDCNKNTEILFEKYNCKPIRAYQHA